MMQRDQSDSSRSRWVCDYGGCERGIETGHALMRISPKGGPFIGMCHEHYAGAPDPVAMIFQEENQKKGRRS